MRLCRAPDRDRRHARRSARRRSRVLLRADHLLLRLNLSADIYTLEVELRWAQEARELLAWLAVQEHAVWPSQAGSGSGPAGANARTRLFTRIAGATGEPGERSNTARERARAPKPSRRLNRARCSSRFRGSQSASSAKAAPASSPSTRCRSISQRGQIVGLFGPSGAGKTTLLQIAAGLLDARRRRGPLRRAPPGSAAQGRVEAAAPARDRVYLGQAQSAKAGLEVLEHVEMPLLVDRHDHRGAARRAREALAACEAEHCVGMMLE